MNAQQRVAKLEALLNRVQTRAREPRASHAAAPAVAFVDSAATPIAPPVERKAPMSDVAAAPPKVEAPAAPPVVATAGRAAEAPVAASQPSRATEPYAGRVTPKAFEAPSTPPPAEPAAARAPSTPPAREVVTEAPKPIVEAPKPIAAEAPRPVIEAPKPIAAEAPKPVSPPREEAPIAAAGIATPVAQPVAAAAAPAREAMPTLTEERELPSLASVSEHDEVTTIQPSIAPHLLAKAMGEARPLEKTPVAQEPKVEVAPARVEVRDVPAEEAKPSVPSVRPPPSVRAPSAALETRRPPEQEQSKWTALVLTLAILAAGIVTYLLMR